MKILRTTIALLLALFSPAETFAEEQGRPPVPAEGQLRGDPAYAALTPEARRGWDNWMAMSVRMRTEDEKAYLRELKISGRKGAAEAREGTGFTVPRKPDAWFRGPEARRIADSLLSWQTPSGGWSKNMNMTKRQRAPGQRYSPWGDWGYVATIDNLATTSQIEFLARTASASGSASCRRGVESGLRYLLAAQMPSGGWPQVFPLQGKYHDHITFNDDAMIHVLTLLRQVEKGRAPWAFVSDDLRAQSKSAVRLGILCILRSQIIVDGKRTAWCAQHHAITLAPVNARAYELASISGGESVGILRFLMTLGKPAEDVRNAIDSGVAWLKHSQLEGGEAGVKISAKRPTWARFYEIGSNRPLFSDSDGKKRYSFSGVKRKRNSYSWFTDQPLTLITQDYPQWQRRVAAGK